jgi:NADH-quinone oxidoreductase subunit D
VAHDLPEDGRSLLLWWAAQMDGELNALDTLIGAQPIWVNRLKGVGWIGVEGCVSLGVTGPMLRAAGVPWDLRKVEASLGYEELEFEVPTSELCDCWGRFQVRVQEMRESVKLVRQVAERLVEPGPVITGDPKIAWPARLTLGPDGLGTSLAHVEEIMSVSMESLIHHFKLVTEGFRVPHGQVYQAIESPRGELGVHAVSDGGTRPYRIHLREPSFVHVQALPMLAIGGMLSDLIACVASVDSVMGGCDR